MESETTATADRKRFPYQPQARARGRSRRGIAASITQRAQDQIERLVGRVEGWRRAVGDGYDLRAGGGRGGRQERRGTEAVVVERGERAGQVRGLVGGAARGVLVFL